MAKHRSKPADPDTADAAAALGTLSALGADRDLSRDEILGADDLARERIDVPEWGGAVYVTTMSAFERDKWEAGSVDNRGKVKVDAALTNLRARLAVLVVVDEDGGKLFRPGDAEALGKKNAAALDRIFDVAKRLNRLGESDIEDLVGNSAGVRNGSSTSA